MTVTGIRQHADTTADSAAHINDHRPPGWTYTAWQDQCWTEAARTGEPPRVSAWRLRLYIAVYRERYGNSLHALTGHHDATHQQQGTDALTTPRGGPQAAQAA